MRERSSTRSAVLNAARRLAEREGIAAISLSAVAAEAGLARAVIYGIFRSKEDLLHSVVASDLDVIAQMMRTAEGPTEPPSFKPPPSKIVRFDSPRVEEFRKENEVRDAASQRPTDEADDVASTPGEVAAAKASDPVLLIEHRRTADGSSRVELQAPEIIVDVPPPAFDKPIAEAAGNGKLFAAPCVPPTRDAEEALEFETPAAEQNFADALAEAIQAPVLQEPVGRKVGAESAPEPVATAPADTAVEAKPAEKAPVKADDEETKPEPEKIADAKPLEPRLPARGERIRLSGKRVLATPELKETMKRLAPAYSAEGDARAEAVAKLQETVSKLESGRADNLERRVHLLEGALADLTSRHEKTVAAHASAATTVAERLGTVVKRIDESDKRLRDSMARMMAEVRDAARRLDEIDFNDRADAARAELLAEPDHHEDTRHHEIHDDELGGPPEADCEPDNGGDDKHTYLSAARRSAATAAQAAAQTAQVEHARRTKLTRKIAMGIAGLAIVLGVAGIALNEFSHAPAARPEADVSIALRRGGQGITHMHHLAHVTHASAAPLDRLAAMANGGNAGAELVVGLRYLNGEGVARNDVEGAKWIIRAANAGDTVAEFWMGSLYQHGRGLAADPVQAVAWYQRAALRGNRMAMHDLGLDYAQGLGVPKDYEQAARWFSLAANLGYVDSEFNLAVLYERGDGVPQSLLDAYKWYAIAAAQGDAGSKSHVDAIASQLSPDDLAAAQAAAQNFKPIDPAPEANGAPTETMLLARY